MRDSSEDFFAQQGASSIRPRRPAPPPPAPRSGGASSRAVPPKARPTSSSSRPTGSSSYYGNPPPAPPARPSSGNNAASSYYGTSSSSSSTPAPAGASNASNFYAAKKPAAPAAAPSYYGSSAPAPAAPPAAQGASDWSSASAPAPQGASDWSSATPAPAAQGASDWSSTQAPAAAQGASDWYTPSASAPAPQQSFAADPQQHQPQQPNVMNPYMMGSSHSNSALEGTMDTSGASRTAPAPAEKRSSSFTLSGMFGSSSSQNNIAPAPTSSGSYYTPYDPMEFENEPPLMEELGINTQNIWFKTKAVLVPLVKFQSSSKYANVSEIVKDNDLAGPLAFALLLGGELLLSGKIHFGYIYGFGLFGCLSMTLVINLMSPVDAVSIWTVMSILGYSLLPVNILALIKVLLLGYLEVFGRVLALFTIAWCTVSSTRLFEQGCGMRDQRYLVAYPLALFYSAFVMITVF